MNVIFSNNILKESNYQVFESDLLEIEPHEINVSQMKPKNVLNSKLWNHGKLNSRVRLRIMDIVDDFIDFLNVKWVKPIDIIFTGSLANFNWNKYSDIDIHIIIKFADVYKDEDFVNDYFEMKKRIWSNDHENLKIYGFPVELYVENYDGETYSSGVYSIEKNEWVKFPVEFDYNEINENFIKRKASSLINKIDCLNEKMENEDDSVKLSKISKSATNLFKKIKFERYNCLKEHGEIGNWNIIYKIIRSKGKLQLLWKIPIKIYDKLNSI